MNERGDALVLVKVDVDANPGLAETYFVSGIPAVKAFREGRVVAQFTGARSRPALEVFLDDLLAPPRVDVLLEELRAAGELPGVVAALDRGDVDAALRLIVEAVPPPMPPVASDSGRRGRLFDRLGPDDPFTSTYRRRLAAALY